MSYINNNVLKLGSLALASMFVIGLSGCAPEVGSEQWCKQMSEKDKGDWTANEAADYAKHCVF
ncbi:DUF3012 domain-containing protein [Shewanella psychropiezotolerans]|uniref:DUF3012 domain-containing protein n=1 Tax=Shewanella psychropiezotolerans TaxID=2593655 RepID=A0ABX5X559_9GAMM|nr:MULTISPECIES: DUF3012 domain-containing protein [Shewanella]MPY26089.1 DUF3012 domain-containing protein [Shewanella sp. YLB-07]QDO85877.1 DUF3012 domain-containing protein [Shewanella psychropiezotolerans]